MSLTAHQFKVRRAVNATPRDASLTRFTALHQAFNVTLKHKFSANQEILLGIDQNKVTFTSTGASSHLDRFFSKNILVRCMSDPALLLLRLPRRRQRMLIRMYQMTYATDDLVSCQLQEDRGPRAFRIVYYNGMDFKSHDFDARDTEDARTSRRRLPGTCGAANEAGVQERLLRGSAASWICARVRRGPCTRSTCRARRPVHASLALVLADSRSKRAFTVTQCGLGLSHFSGARARRRCIFPNPMTHVVRGTLRVC